MHRHVTKIALFASVLAYSGSAFAGIADTAHNFSAETWMTEGEICIACHTPHNADLTMSEVPLWNHTTTTATFTTYTSSTLDATMGTPTGASLACLSCHDGSVALDSYGGATGSTTITGAALLSTDLSNDHPVSFTYNTALATTDGELEDPSTATSGLGGTIDADMLFASKMECASCHDVHSSAFPKFLIMDNTGSALCLTCHVK